MGYVSDAGHSEEVRRRGRIKSKSESRSYSLAVFGVAPLCYWGAQDSAVSVSDFTDREEKKFIETLYRTQNTQTRKYTIN